MTPLNLNLRSPNALKFGVFSKEQKEKISTLQGKFETNEPVPFDELSAGFQAAASEPDSSELRSLVRARIEKDRTAISKAAEELLQKTPDNLKPMVKLMIELVAVGNARNNVSYGMEMMGSMPEPVDNGFIKEFLNLLYPYNINQMLHILKGKES
ncbi:MAG: hypothetical protein K2X66_10455 [Cyanobacteria bacterium]|nr:hypothetical protein [Cyanobacteriota bacterium]